jgi:hypothetical protein
MGMNIQDRIAKLEKELKQLKIDLAEDDEITEVVWKPRVGEIILVSDNKEQWYYSKFSGYEDDDSYCGVEGEYWTYAKPLNDPMVIQLIPHKPGDPRPCDEDKDVIALHGNEFSSQRYYTCEKALYLYWGVNDDESDIFAWAPL